MSCPLAARVVIGLLAAVAAHAQPPEDADGFVAHLEFGAYTVEVGEQAITARHETYLNMVLKAFKGGVLLQTYVETSQRKKDDVLEVINKLNTNSIAARYYADDEGDTMVEAWYPGGYERQRFSAFLEAWHTDTKGQYSTIAELVDD